MAKAVASIGLMGLLTAVVSYQVGSQVIEVNPIFPQNHLHLLGINIATDRLWLAATIIGLGIVLTVLFRFTRFGLATRASAETEVGALVSGLSPDRIALVNWIISFVVCGIAGVLIAPLVPLEPGTYTLFIVPALAAAVVGRFHSLGWAITAGLAIGGARVAVGLRQRRSPRVPRRRRASSSPRPRAGRARLPGRGHAEPRHAHPGHLGPGAPPALAHPHGGRRVRLGLVGHLPLHGQRPRRAVHELHHRRSSRCRWSW